MNDLYGVIYKDLVTANLQWKTLDKAEASLLNARHVRLHGFRDNELFHFGFSLFFWNPALQSAGDVWNVLQSSFYMKKKYIK
jgi:hypothetical protein